MAPGRYKLIEAFSRYVTGGAGPVQINFRVQRVHVKWRQAGTN